MLTNWLNMRTANQKTLGKSNLATSLDLYLIDREILALSWIQLSVKSASVPVKGRINC